MVSEEDHEVWLEEKATGHRLKIIGYKVKNKLSQMFKFKKLSFIFHLKCLVCELKQFVQLKDFEFL